MGILLGYVSEHCVHPPRGLPNPKLNVLVDDNGRARLTGFFTLTIAPDLSTTTLYGIPQFLSPELLAPSYFGLKHSRQTGESDCYALGMVIYQVLNGRMPFFQDRPTEVMSRIMDGRRPERPEGNTGKLFTDDIWEILELCWKHQPGDRISAKDVLLRLERIPSPLRLNRDMETDTGDQSDDVSSCSSMFLNSTPGSPLIVLAV